MSDKNKARKIELTILELLSSKSEIGVHDVAEVLGLSKANETDRKSIRRVFNNLIKKGELKAKGAARARVYLKAISTTFFNTQPSTGSEGEKAFKDIELSEKSKVLLKYVSQSITARKPIGYDQNFLRAYVPNETFNLTSDQRVKLRELGIVETHTRPAGTYARNILNRLLIDLSWNSSRLEGNTYSLLETKRLIEMGQAVDGKDIRETQMILNHKAAIEYIVEGASEDKISIHEVCSIHSLLSDNLLGDPAASGRIRNIAVGIGGTTYLPLDNPHILKECFSIFIDKFNLIEDEFEQSLFSLVHLSYMQAFEDVNKRTARLVANIPLIKSNFKPLSFTDVSQEAYIKALLGIYEMNDVSLMVDLYIWAYSRSAYRYSAVQQSLGEPNAFKLKHKPLIQEIIRAVILEKTTAPAVVPKIQSLIKEQNLPEAEAAELFQVIETDIASLHDGNIARFKIRPNEFQAWIVTQKG